jgi:hypothetical protein
MPFVEDEHEYPLAREEARCLTEERDRRETPRRAGSVDTPYIMRFLSNRTVVYSRTAADIVQDELIQRSEKAPRRVATGESTYSGYLNLSLTCCIRILLERSRPDPGLSSSSGSE